MHGGGRIGRCESEPRIRPELLPAQLDKSLLWLAVTNTSGSYVDED